MILTKDVICHLAFGCNEVIIALVFANSRLHFALLPTQLLPTGLLEHLRRTN